ncbi:hypothetical protein [Tropicimonas marinistellae]|uniref:hypothetical protein n=1 Tax=Tropicimonas marinistellae TaxID=1739787 RepID=UPI000837518B|nr:hypothetical protein [Tropicimonas marinistellae]
MDIGVDDDRFRHLVLLANSAALDQRKWQWFLEELHHLAGGIRVQMFCHDIHASSSLGFLEFGYDPSYVEAYETHFVDKNPWTPMFETLPVGKIVQSDQVFPIAELERTEFYNEWVRPQDDIVGGAGAVIDRGDGRMALIGGNIPRHLKDTLEAPFAALLDRLLPFVQNSLQVSRMLGDLTIENRALRDGMDPDLTAVFALDRTGRVHFANGRARRLVELGEIVQQDSRARLRFKDSDAQAALVRAIYDHFQPEMTVTLPFFAGKPRGRFLCRTAPISECDGPLPWLVGNGSQATGFILLMLAPAAPRTRLAPREPIIG